MTKIYANWDRMDSAVQEAYRASARAFLETLEPAVGDWVRAS